LIINLIISEHKRNLVIDNPNHNNYLIFVLGATEDDLDGLEKLGVEARKVDKIALASKRIDQYLKGGIFAPTPKTLLLDLLSKKLSPHVITGFVILNAESSLRGSHAQGHYTFMSNVCF